MCINPALAIHSGDTPPPLYICSDCVQALKKDHGDYMVDLLMPMPHVSSVCENKVCFKANISYLLILHAFWWLRGWHFWLKIHFQKIASKFSKCINDKHKICNLICAREDSNLITFCIIIYVHTFMKTLIFFSTYYCLLKMSLKFWSPQETTNGASLNTAPVKVLGQLEHLSTFDKGVHSESPAVLPVSTVLAHKGELQKWHCLQLMR